MGWHLRFSRASEIEVLLDPKASAQVIDHAGWVGGWACAVEERDGYVLALLTRTS